MIGCVLLDPSTLGVAMNTFSVLRIGGVILGMMILVGTSTDSVSGQTDPQVGTWVLDVTKSKYSPGPPPRSQTAVYAASANGLKVVATGTDAAGKPTTTEFTVTFDGKDHPAKGSPDFTTISARRIDSHTIEYTRKGAGNVQQKATRSVSKDGKTATLTVVGVDGQGRKIDRVQIYVKK
jgi:hypothetical protein